MTMETTSRTRATVDRPTIPAWVAYLPGRTVELVSTVTPARRGVVLGADDRELSYVVRWTEAGVVGTAHGFMLRAVHPDRPTLANDNLYAVTLGELLARRDGPDALAGFHDGYNNGHTAYKETARDLLREMDAVAAEAKRAGCPYTYVLDPSGQRRPSRTAYEPGDTLIVCPWYCDGPGRLFCAPHAEAEAQGDRSSIFYPSDAGPWRFEAPIGAESDA